MPRRGLLSQLTQSRTPAPVPAADPQEMIRALQAEERRVKDGVAKLCGAWRQRGTVSAQHAIELESVMGWRQPGTDLLTGAASVSAADYKQPPPA